MFSVISCLGATHDWRFVVGAITVCLIGAFSTVIMLARAQECVRKHSRVWIAAASVTGGTSIWATHFIAMLAYDGGFPVAYDAAITALSVLVSIAMSWAAFTAAFRWSSMPGIVAAGFTFGAGIAAMHFSGMNAVEAQGHLTYAPDAIALALVTSVFFGTLALLVIRNFSGHGRVVLGTLLVTATVCGLHFTSMGGVTLTPEPLVAWQSPFLIDRAALAAIVAAVSSVVVLLGGAAALMDRHLTDVKGLADAAMEGLLFVQEGKVVEANESMLRLIGCTTRDVLSRGIDEILVHHELPRSNASIGKGSGFGELISPNGGRIEVEVLRRELEYRGRQSLVFVVRDLTERRQSERLIDHLARHDPLTGLANRREFDHRLAKLLRGRYQQGHELALICLDLDNFKAINDLRGHAAGDAFLRAVAEVLTSSISSNDFVARLGGDEFAIVQVGGTQPAAAQNLSNVVMEGIAGLNLSGKQLISFGASIGVAVAGPADNSTGTLHGHADAALYEAKKAGRGVVRLFDAALEERLRLRQQTEADLLRALSGQELAVDYQPFTSATGGGILGYKANAYWKQDSEGPLSARNLLSSAQECGLLNRVVYWTIESAAAEAQTWGTDLRLAVDLPYCQLLSPGCYEEISRIIRCAELDPRRLDLVIPEAVLCRRDATAGSVLQRFKRMGVGIVLTDLLSEQSAMATLHQFGFDRVRVDAASIELVKDRFSSHIHRASLEYLQAAGMEIIVSHTGSAPRSKAIAASDAFISVERFPQQVNPPSSFQPMISPRPRPATSPIIRS